MIIDRIEIGEIWDGGFGDCHFQCRPAGSAKPFEIGTMYRKEFEAWKDGKVTLDEIKTVIDPDVYKMLREM